MCCSLQFVLSIFAFLFILSPGISVKGRGAAPLAEDETKTFDADTGESMNFLKNFFSYQFTPDFQRKMYVGGSLV